MQPVLERGSIDKPLTFDVGLIHVAFQSNCAEGLHFSAFHCSSITDVKRRYTKHCNVNKMADSSGLGPGKFITLLTL